MTETLQFGHDECDNNQVSIHLTWKPWPHLGKILTFSPPLNSPRQIGQHSFTGISSPDSYATTGIWLSASLLSPVGANSDKTWSGSIVNLWLHRIAQRMIEFITSAPINEHSKAARITIMLLSKLSPPPPCEPLLPLLPIIGGGAAVWVSSRRRCRLWWWCLTMALYTIFWWSVNWVTNPTGPLLNSLCVPTLCGYVFVRKKDIERDSLNWAQLLQK